MIRINVRVPRYSKNQATTCWGSGPQKLAWKYSNTSIHTTRVQLLWIVGRKRNNNKINGKWSAMHFTCNITYRRVGFD